MIEERDPTADEQSVYSAKIDALPVTVTVVGNIVHYNREITPVASEIAHLQITTDKLQSQFQTAMGQTVSDDIISAGEDDLAQGVPFSTLREAIFNSSAETNAISTVYQNIYGQAATTSDQQYAQLQLYQGGVTFDQFQINEAHSARETEALKQIIRDVQDREPADSDSAWIQGTEDSIGNGQISYADARNALIDFEGENGVFDAYEQKLYGVNASDADRQWLRDSLHSGWSLAALRNVDAHSDRETAALQQLIRDIQDREPVDADKAWIQGTEDALGSSQTSFTATRDGLIDLDGENAVFDAYDQALYGSNADQATRDWLRASLHAGWTMAGIREVDAHSALEKQTIGQVIRDVQGREPDDTRDAAFFSETMDDLGAGRETLAQVYTGLASWDADFLKPAMTFITSQNVGADDAWIVSSIQQIGARETTYWGAVQGLAQSDAAYAQIQNVYADWGQLPPNTTELQTAGTALYNLSYAWITTVQTLSADQLATQAAAYNPSVSVSFQDMVSNLASSTTQAVGLEANLLVNTYLETSADPDAAKADLAAGGENALAAALDEGSVLTELKKIENENTNDCDPVVFRNNKTIVENIKNSDVMAANQTFGDVNGSTWDQSYKDLGIQWKTKTSGTTTNQQGLPYEAWVQNRLNPSQDANGVIWLQPLKANWKVFDHWDEKNAIATSDKTINLAAPSYKSSPYAVAARVEASVDKMLGYITDGTKDETVRFNAGDIGSYVLNLAVPYIADPEAMDPQTAAEWKALCRAYHDALAEMSAESKIFTFNITTVS
ncbi:endonuclease toxin domain-containing protein [Gluconobacter frateurii]|nr:hypothetical protein [Gluconobacter frateurii]